MSALPEPHWSHFGNCLGVHPTVMFPERGDTSGWRRARLVCEGCPVLEECQEESVDELYGMWGGLSPKQRQRIRLERDRQKAPHGTRARYYANCKCDDCCAANAEYQRRRRLA